MNKLIAFVAITMLLLGACAGPSGPVNKVLSPSDFKDKIEELNNEILVDLRSHGELHQTGPIKGARNLDFNSGRFLAAVAGFEKDQPIMLYCASGGRSASAAKQLKEEGFTNVYDLDGGVTAWKAAGLPVSAHRH